MSGRATRGRRGRALTLGQAFSLLVALALALFALELGSVGAPSWAATGLLAVLVALGGQAHFRTPPRPPR